MFRTALRTVLAHKARLLMTVLAVMLGVAFVSGTLVFTDTLGNAFQSQSSKSYKDVAVGVTSFDARESDNAAERKLGPGISERTLDKMKAVDGVDGVTARVSGFAGVADPDGKLIGDGWSNKGATSRPARTAGTPPTRSPTARDPRATTRSRSTRFRRPRASTRSATRSASPPTDR